MISAFSRSGNSVHFRSELHISPATNKSQPPIPINDGGAPFDRIRRFIPPPVPTSLSTALKIARQKSNIEEAPEKLRMKPHGRPKLSRHPHARRSPPLPTT